MERQNRGRDRRVDARALRSLDVHRPARIREHASVRRTDRLPVRTRGARVLTAVPRGRGPLCSCSRRCGGLRRGGRSRGRRSRRSRDTSGGGVRGSGSRRLWSAGVLRLVLVRGRLCGRPTTRSCDARCKRDADRVPLRTRQPRRDVRESSVVAREARVAEWAARITRTNVTTASCTRNQASCHWVVSVKGTAVSSHVARSKGSPGASVTRRTCSRSPRRFNSNARWWQ
jgi:hypothetical protein